MAFALAGAFASVNRYWGGPAGWNEGTAPSPASLAPLLWALAAGLSLSAAAGCVASPLGEVPTTVRRVRAGLVVVHIGLLLTALGNTIGGRLGFRGQVLIPRSGTADTAMLRDRTALPLPFTLEYRPADHPAEGGVLVRRTDNGAGDATPVRTGGVVPYSDGLHLYPAGEVRLGARGVLSIFDRDGRTLLEGLEVQEGDAVAIPGTGAEVLVTGLWGSRNDLGPAARLVLRGPDRRIDSFLIYRALPGMDRARGDDLVFQLATFMPGREYLRFWVVQDPGLPLAALGGLLFGAGTLVGLTGSRRRVGISPGTRRQGAGGPAPRTALALVGSPDKWAQAGTAPREAAPPQGPNGGERYLPA